jgi:HAD superfamily hydrolase (TIGR01509 family)
MAVEGVILDVDGTLVSSNDAHALAWVEAFGNYGYEIPFEQVRPLIGMGGDQVLPRLVSNLNDKEGVGKQIVDRRKELVLDKFSTGVAPTNGARALVKKMRDDGLHLIIASSATEQEMELLLKIAQVDELVSEFATSSDAEASKPESDIVEAALNQAHLQPEHTVMLGDTPYDIEAAKKVGVDVIAFRSGGFSDEQLQGAIAIYDDPADLLRHYETSPLAAESSPASVATPETVASHSATTNVSIPSEPVSEMGSESWQSVQSQAATFFENTTSSLSTFFKQNQSLLINAGWVLLALVGLQLLFTILDVIDNIPLMTPILKLVDLLSTGRFVWRYLLRASNRP